MFVSRPARSGILVDLAAADSSRTSPSRAQALEHVTRIRAQALRQILIEQLKQAADYRLVVVLGHRPTTLCEHHRLICQRWHLPRPMIYE
jgi:hypothetical protein